MELWCSCVFSLFCCLIIGCYSEGVLSQLNGNISVLSQHLEITTVALKDGQTIRYLPVFQSVKPNLRLPCHTCDPSYNIFQIDSQYLVPNYSSIHAVSQNNGYSIDIGHCDPLSLHSGKTGRIWIYCAVQDKLVDIVELQMRTNGSWYMSHGTNYGVTTSSNSVSRNSLLFIREKDGANISFMYFTNGGRLLQRGLEDKSLVRYNRPSLLCNNIQKLFYVNEEMLMLQCILKRSPENTGLVLFNLSQPSTNPELFQDLGTLSGVVYVSDGIVVLLMSEIVIIRNAVNTIKLEQVIGLQPPLSSQGIFVPIHRTTYFVCTNRNTVFFIDIARALEGNNTAYLKMDSDNEICVDKECIMQYTSGILFVPLKVSDNLDGLALYNVDPIKQITTIYAITPYRYFFTPERSAKNQSTEPGFDVNNNPEKNQNAGSIAGSVVGTLVVLVITTLIIISITYVCYKKRSQYYYQYQTAEVRFDNEDESIVIVPGRFNHPIWNITDDRSTEATQPPTTMNNETGKSSAATNATLKEKNTNVDGNNVRHSVNDDEGCYGVETREDQISLKEYIDCLVVGTMQH